MIRSIWQPLILFSKILPSFDPRRMLARNEFGTGLALNLPAGLFSWAPTGKSAPDSTFCLVLAPDGDGRSDPVSALIFHPPATTGDRRVVHDWWPYAVRFFPRNPDLARSWRVWAPATAIFFSPGQRSPLPFQKHNQTRPSAYSDVSQLGLHVLAMGRRPRTQPNFFPSRYHAFSKRSCSSVPAPGAPAPPPVGRAGPASHWADLERRPLPVTLLGRF